MSSSREESPDWLRCFQAPASATLVLSSDSEPSQGGCPLKEDRTDSGEKPLSISPKIVNDDYDDDDDKETIEKFMGGTNAKSVSSKASKLKSPKKGLKLEDNVSPQKNKSANSKKRKGDNDSDKKVSKKGLDSSVLTLSSDSDLSPENSPKRKNRTPHGKASDQNASEQIGEADDTVLIGSDDKAPAKKASKDKSPRKGPETSIKEKKKKDVKREGNGSDVEATEDEAPEKQVESHVSSAWLPLMLSEKVHRTKALVECEGDSIDLGGDMGSVGRVVISDNLSGDPEMCLDLKGTIYKTAIVPSRTFCVVSFGQSEAKVEAIMNDFIQLKPQSNVFEAETMVEGTLDGFLFDSDEEADKVPKGVSHQTDNNEDGEAKANGKTKRKSEKTLGVTKKRGKAVGGKTQAQKNVKKKAPASKKKTKTKK